MKYFSVFLILLFIAAACSSSNPDEQADTKNYSNLIKLQSPDTTNHDSSNVYIDSVKIVDRGFLISGNLPDGCSKLHKASHSMQGDSLNITLTAWKPADKMCTQSLTPFKFMYDKLSEQQMDGAAGVTVNGKSYRVQ